MLVFGFLWFFATMGTAFWALNKLADLKLKAEGVHLNL
jgi:hypothetical protein